MSYDNIRLEKHYADGTSDVVAYFAPNFEVTPVMKNKLFAADRPKGEGTVTRDMQRFRYELVIQGVFEDTRNLPKAHADAVLALDSNWSTQGYATPRDQVNRIAHYLMNVGGPYRFYDDTDQYTAYDIANADIKNGVFPTVQVDEFRPTRESGRPRFHYTLKVVVGYDPSADAPGGA